MTTATAADRRVLASVTAELDWTPEVSSASVVASIRHGVVTLAGSVGTPAERTAAATAALRVQGVIAIANEIEVHLVDSSSTSDDDIAGAVSHAVRWNSVIPTGQVHAEVTDHVVTLSGLVDWDFQRTAARRLVEHITGVSRVDDHIRLTERPSAAGTESLVRQAIVRRASEDASSIAATVDGTDVTLTGEVGSWTEKQRAGHAAWSSPHVTSVTNKIRVMSRP